MDLSAGILKTSIKEEIIDEEEATGVFDTNEERLFHGENIDVFKIEINENEPTFACDVPEIHKTEIIESEREPVAALQNFNRELENYREEKDDDNDKMCYNGYISNPSYKEFKDIFEQCTEEERRSGFREFDTYAECILCDQRFIRKMPSHFTSSHMKCVYCHKVVTYHIISEHFKLYHKSEPTIKCLECQQDIDTKKLLGHHYSHRDYYAVCPICGKIGIRPQMHRHMSIHNKEKIKCEICHRTYSYLSFKEHKNFHIDVNETCEICQKTFTNKGMYKRHLAKHKNTVHLKTCDVCHKTLRKDKLAQHLRSHSGELPFKCNFCEKCFNSNWNRQAHERQHTNTKPYKCTECLMEFTHNVSLKTHLKKKHKIDLWKEKKVKNPPVKIS